jgi:hypothetical protein
MHSKSGVRNYGLSTQGGLNLDKPVSKLRSIDLSAPMTKQSTYSSKYGGEVVKPQDFILQNTKHIEKLNSSEIGTEAIVIAKIWNFQIL